MATKISHLPDIIKIDEHLVLRATSSESYPEFEKLVVINQKHLARWLPWAVNAPDKSSVVHYAQAPEKKQINESANWNIFLDHQLVGAIGLNNHDHENLKHKGRNLEIGYWLDKDTQGQGVMSRTVTALTGCTFEQTDAPYLEIACDAANIESANVAIRNGFSLHREVSRTPDGPSESGTGQFYRLTRDEWISRN